jgi:hypothetical protein
MSWEIGPHTSSLASRDRSSDLAQSRVTFARCIYNLSIITIMHLTDREDLGYT